jgi:hypothetical protein
LAAPARGREEASHLRPSLVGSGSAEQARQIYESPALATSPSQSALLPPSLVRLIRSRLALSVGNEIHAAAAHADLSRNGPARQTPLTQQAMDFRNDRIGQHDETPCNVQRGLETRELF